MNIKTPLVDCSQQAREQFIDYKTVKLVTEIFELYRSKNEQYLISKRRNRLQFKW